MGMDPKQQRVLEEQDEPAPEDEPRDISEDARPRAGKAEGGQASARTGQGVVSEEVTNAPPTGKGNLGRRRAGPDDQPRTPGREDHR